MKQTTTIGKEGSTGTPPAPLKLGFSRIVVATDFSPRSEAAVDYAVELARRLGAQVTLLHLVPEPTAFDYTMGGIPADEWEQAREEAKNRLEHELARAKITYQGIESLMRTGIALREEIVNAAKEVSADLVVISTHGYTGWKHLLFGSDAEKMLHEAPCPVLVVR
jgi:universal stress protein A